MSSTAPLLHPIGVTLEPPAARAWLAILWEMYIDDGTLQDLAFAIEAAAQAELASFANADAVCRVDLGSHPLGSSLSLGVLYDAAAWCLLR